MKIPIRHLLWVAILIAVASLTGGCAATLVHPWDRDLLAEPQMKFIPSPSEYAIDQHIYFSKEGSTGGLDPAGGGCGCN